MILRATGKVSNEAWKNWRDLKIRDARAASMYLLEHSRNNWRFFGSDADLCFELAEAQQAAESRRVQGTRFEILESPAVVLSTPEADVLVTEFMHEHPLQGFRLPWRSHGAVTLAEFAERVPDRPGTTAYFVAPGKSALCQPLRTRGGYLDWLSNSHGSQRSLSWASRAADRSDKAVRRVAKRCRSFRADADELAT